MKALSLAALVLLAGCFGDDPGTVNVDEDDGEPAPPGQEDPGVGPTPPAEPAPMLVDFHYEGCVGLEAVLAMDLETARSAVPEGYTVLEVDGAATAEVRWLTCERFYTAAAEVNNTVYGYVAVAIDPPNGEASAFYRTSMLVQEDIMETLWAAAGYALVVDDMTYETTQVDAGPVSLGRYVTGFGDFGAEVLGALRSSDERSITMYTDTNAGTLIWTGHEAVDVHEGQGTIEGTGGELQSIRIVLDGVYGDNDLWLHPAAS